MKKTTWKIGGEAGFGIMSSGVTFSKVVSRHGQQLFDYVEYPSLIRGGHNAYEVVFSLSKVHGLKSEIDYLVCLNKETFDFNRKKLTDKSVIVYDNNEFEPERIGIQVAVPFKKILQELKGANIMRNTIALGASLALLDGDLQVLFEILSDQFKHKGEKVISFNEQFAKYGYDFIVKNFSTVIKPILVKKNNPNPQLVLTGNDAFSLGSIIGDCRLYVAYPMTPASSVLTTLASWQEKTGIIARHAEDEISVINTAVGGSFAGVRSSVGTSGGGFALMVETLSFAGVAEVPLVVFLSQRPGPATGMPTWTEQGDLLFAVHSGHGEFPKIVLAPGDVEEMIELTAKAFNLADIYQTPVIVMSDMALSESHGSIEQQKVDRFISDYKIDRGKIVKKPSQKIYHRYGVTPDGISEMLIPGFPGHFYQANSYEHVEDGHTTEEAEVRVEQVDKRNRKSSTYLKNDFELPKVYGNLESADTIFVCWGSVKGPVLAACEELEEIGKKVTCIHFTHVFPLDGQKITPFFAHKGRYILVENNSQGQFGRLLQQETGINFKDKLLKYDGRPFFSEEIVTYIK